MSGVHVIRKQIFQFEMEEAAQYRLLSERISALGDRILPEALDLVLSDLVPEGVHLVIDRLEIDVGSFRPEELREQLVPRIMAALRQALQAVRDGRPSGGVVRVEDGPARNAGILEHFIRHGRLPWWAGSKNISIRRMVNALLLSDPAVFGRIFVQVRKDAPRLRRLLQHMDTEDLLLAWQRTQRDMPGISPRKLSDMVSEVVRHLQPAVGRETATETVRLHLLQGLLRNVSTGVMVGRYDEARRLPAGLTASGRIPIPFRSFFDQISGSRNLKTRRLPSAAAGVATDPSTLTGSYPAGGRQRLPPRRSPTGVPDATAQELQAFGGFLQDGRLEANRRGSMAAEVVRIFRTLVEDRLPELSDMIRDMGRAERVRRRILDAIPSPRLRRFFEAAVPGKREAIEWVESVYLETQRKIRPINQTNVRVQRSVDEITLELFTTMDLNAIGNAAFLRMHIRRMALKHHIRYRDLVRAIWRSSSLFDVSPDGRLYRILKEIYEEVFPPGGSQVPDSSGSSTRHPDPDAIPSVYDRTAGGSSDTDQRQRIYADPDAEAERRFISEFPEEAVQTRASEEGAGMVPQPDPDQRSGMTEDPQGGDTAQISFTSIAGHEKKDPDPSARPDSNQEWSRHSAGMDRGPDQDRYGRQEQFRGQGEISSRSPAGTQASGGSAKEIQDRSAPADDDRMAVELRRDDRRIVDNGGSDQSSAADPSKGQDGVSMGSGDIPPTVPHQSASWSSEADLTRDGRPDRSYTGQDGTGSFPAGSSSDNRPGAGLGVGGRSAADEGAWRRAIGAEDDVGSFPAGSSSDNLPGTDPGAGGRSAAEDISGRRVIGAEDGAGSFSTGPSSDNRPGAGPGAGGRSAAEDVSGWKGPDGRGREAGGSTIGSADGQSAGGRSVSDERRDGGKRSRESGAAGGRTGEDMEEAQDAGGVRTPLDLMEPVPAELLDILPRAVVRALILVKGTQVFGRHTRALQELISTYIRLTAPTPLTLDAADMPALLTGLSEYLGVEPDFLLFAFRYSAAKHPGDALAVSVSERFRGAHPEDVRERPDAEATGIGLLELVRHLTAYRWYYEASHVRVLLLPALRGRRISRELFSALLRLLYDEQAERVDREWQKLTDMPISAGAARDPEVILDEARHAFVASTLDGAGAPFSLQRIFGRVRRILQPERTGASMPPAGLADVRGYFSPAATTATKFGGRKAAQRRENSILRFYHILNLDLVLQGVGDRFFDNIPFSFELLLTKHRGKLLDILRDHRFDPELAQFFAYADPSGIFEQIRRLLPAAQTDRVARTFRQAVEILLRSRWLTPGREELTSFTVLDAYAYYLSPDLEPPVLAEVVFETMRRASLAGLLSASFRERLAGLSDAQWMAQIARSIGPRRRDLLFPLLAIGAENAGRSGILRYRNLLQLPGDQAVDETAALTLRAILDSGRFPEGHVLRAADPGSHPDYLKRLASTGRSIERVFADPGPGYGALMSGLLDRGQLIRAVAARFRLRRDQVRTLTQAWYDRSATDGWQPEDFLEALLQSPVAAGKTRGRQSLNRAAFKILTTGGRLAWWDVMSALRDPLRAADASLEGLKTSDVTDTLKGDRSDWMEFYFGMMQSPETSNRGVQRVLGIWMRGMSVMPAAGTRRQRFRSLVESIMGLLSEASPDPERMHRAWLDAHSFFDGLAPSSVRNAYERLIRAGMPVEVLEEHLQSRGIEVPNIGPSDKLIPEAATLSYQESLLRGMITPEELAALWRPGGRDAARILAALRAWVTGRHWNARAAERLSRTLPPQAMAVLMERLSPGVDLRRIIEAWSVFLVSARLYADRQQAAAAIRRMVLTKRLWLHQTARRLHVELFMASGLPEAFRRGDIPGELLAEGIDGVPPVFLKLAADMLATRSKMTVDELLALWPVTWSEPAAGARLPGGGDRSRYGTVAVSEAVLAFLESGIIPAPVGSETPAMVTRRLTEELSQAGPGLFLTLPSLHDSLLPRALEFYRPSALSGHVFSSLIAQSTDAALRRYLEVFADLAGHSRVRQSELILFLKTYRRFFAAGATARTGQTEGFLRAALAIPAFSRLARQTLSVLPRSAWRTTRSPFLQFIIRRELRDVGVRPPDIDALTVFFLRTGLLHPDAQEADLPTLFRRIRERLDAGDPDLRATIFLYAKDRMARRRIRELFGGSAETVLYEWILPGLTEGLSMLTDLLRVRFGIDAWRATGARTDRDRQERVLAWWSQSRPQPIHVIQLLKAFMEQVMAALDERQWQRVRHPDITLFTEAERQRWNELKAILPALIEAPSDEARRLAPPEAEDQGPRMNEPDTESDPVDGITVQNGGLVLLWPYLGRLFTRLGLSDGKTFPGEEEQSRAIRLTEYLVTGSKEMEEHQLALNKLICGAPLDFQVPAEIELTPEEEELCGKMLQGVIRNWEKMKTTRPNTFRETFLKREARLYKVEDRWELVVARKPYDMLLDSLPWNISMIQLSWMPERLVVHWK